MAEPIRASQVQPEDVRTDTELLKHRARRAVQAQATRREALDRAGAFGLPTQGRIESIEARSKREAEDRMAKFRQRQQAKAAVRKAMEAKR
jgi:hypothetical protein